MEVIGEVEVRIIEGNCVDRHNAWREVKTAKRSRRCLGGKRFSSLPLLYMISPWHQPHSLVNILVSKAADKNARSVNLFHKTKFSISIYLLLLPICKAAQTSEVTECVVHTHTHTHVCCLQESHSFIPEFLQCSFDLNLHCCL